MGQIKYSRYLLIMAGYDSELLGFLRAKDKRVDNPLLEYHISETLIRLKQFRDFVKKNEANFDYPGFKDNSFFNNLALALVIHDLGKIDYAFQRKVFDRSEREEAKGDWTKVNGLFETFRKHENYWNFKVRHEILSAIWSVALLGNELDSRKIRTAVLLHHYNEYYLDEKNLPDIIRSYRDEILAYLDFLLAKKDELIVIVKDLISVAKENGFEVKLPTPISFDSLEELRKAIENRADDISLLGEFYEIETEKHDYDFFVFLGILRRCDYSASGDVDIEGVADLNSVFKEVEQNITSKIEEKLKKKVVLWQKEALTSSKSKNVLLVAPTGSGKTEFALMWAGRNNRKLIYTLPLRVALNDLFARFGRDDGYFNKEFVDILHSTSFIEHLKGSREGREFNIGGKVTSSKMMSYPILLTTPDQVFLASLKYYGFDKLLSIYPTSSIVIDEIQAYNPEMAAIIIKTLEIISELKGAVLVITATLPPYFRPFLIKAEADSRSKEIVSNLDFHPVDLSKWSKEKKAIIKNYGLKRHKIEFVDKPLFEYSSKTEPEIEEGFGKIEETLTQSTDQNVLIIVNNVGKAIKLYEKLGGRNDPGVYLLHSRLLENEKDKRINEIKQNLKDGKKGMVLISTQLVEASVDIDFDILFTEISPIDSQVQRWGRVYRNRPEDYQSNGPNIHIFSEADRGTNAIYHKETLLKTIDILKQKEGELLDCEAERALVEKTFDETLSDGRTLKERYINEIYRNLDYLKYFTAERRSEAQRLFRQIAGIQAIVPEAMAAEKGLTVEDTKLNNVLAEIIRSDDFTKDTSWKIIIERLKEEGINVPKVEVELEDFRWKLKAILYRYSMSVPMYYFEKHQRQFYREFKNFRIISKPLNEDECKEIVEYGKFSGDKDVDSSEIDAFENKII